MAATPITPPASNVSIEWSRCHKMSANHIPRIMCSTYVESAELGAVAIELLVVVADELLCKLWSVALQLMRRYRGLCVATWGCEGSENVLPIVSKVAV
jgi:hypothetical protein